MKSIWVQMVVAKYLQLAEQLADDIKKGNRQFGDKLMSIRHYAELHQVSINTAIACYRELENMGLLEAKNKRGYFVSFRKESAQVPVPQFSAKQSSAVPYIFHYDTEHPFARAQSVLSSASAKQLKSSMNNTIRHHFQHMQGYGEKQGLESLRLALSKHYSKYGVELLKDSLIVNNGCLDAIRIAILVTTEPGDVILIASPCFNGLLSLIIQLGRNVLEIPSNESGIDTALVYSLLSQQKVNACIFSANHHNPQGGSFSTADKQILAALSNQYNIPLIEDDVYQELSFDGKVKLPIKAFDKAGTVIWCSSFSKTLASGFRIGWASAGKYKTNFLAQRATESFGVNLPLQYMTENFLQSGHYKRHLSAIRQQLSKNVNQYRLILLTKINCEGLVVSNPAGGMVLWVYVPNLDSELLQTQANKKGIGIRIGSEFSMTNLYTEYFRINVGYSLDKALERQLLALCHLVNQSIKNK